MLGGEANAMMGRSVSPCDGRPGPAVPGLDVLRRIGSGSAGEVWMARSDTGAWRAVKVICRERFEDDRAFRREFEAVRRFEDVSREHPGFVDILHTGWAADGQSYYYVMELGDGASEAWGVHDYQPMTLSRVLEQRGRMEVDALVDLGICLCGALVDLHARGLIHRDVKPSNVVYAKGVAKLADVGTVIGSREASSYVGTEGYIAPEGPNSPQSDVYALGKLLYVAATGKDRRDFPDPGVEMETGPDAPRLRELNLVLLKACAAHPRRRYATALEFLADLQRIRDGRSIRWHRRRRMLALASGWGLVVLAVAGGLSWVPRGRAGKPGARSAFVDEPVRSQWAMGQARMDAGDDAGALACFAEALSTASRDTDEEVVQRVRLGLLLDRIPDLVHAWQPGRPIASITVSPDGKQVAACDDAGCVTLMEDGRMHRLGSPRSEDALPSTLRYVGDRELVASWLPGESWVTGVMRPRAGRILDSSSGRPAGPCFESDGAVAFDGAGTLVALAAQGGDVELREARSGRLLQRWTQHGAKVVCLAFSDSSRWLAAADENGVVRVLAVGREGQAGPPLAVRHPVSLLAFTPGEKQLVIVSDDGMNRSTVRVHGMAGDGIGPSAVRLGSRLHGIDVHAHGGRRMILSQAPDPVEAPTGLTIRDGSAPGTILAHLQLGGRCRCFAVSPDGRWIAAGGDGVGARVWDMESGEPLTAMLGHAGGVRALAFSPDGTRLLTGGADGMVREWDLSAVGSRWRTIRVEGRLANRWTTVHPYPAASVGPRHVVLATMRDGRLVATSVDLVAGREEPMPPMPEDLSCDALVAAPLGDSWAMLDASATLDVMPRDVGLWQRMEGQWKLRRLAHSEPVLGAAFVGSPRRLLTLDASHRLHSWSGAGRRLKEEAPSSWAGQHPVFSRDGTRLFSHEGGNVVRIVNVAHPGGQPVRVTMPDRIECLAVSHDGGLLAAGVRGSGLHVYSGVDGQPVALPGGAGGAVVPHPVTMSWAPGSRRLIVQSTVADAQLLDWESDAVRTLGGTHEGPPTTKVSFGEDDRWIVVQTSHDDVWLVDAATGLRVGPAFRHATRVRHAMVTREGQLVVLADPNLVRALALEPEAGAAAHLQRRARWLSGRRWAGLAGLEWTKPDEADASAWARRVRTEGALSERAPAPRAAASSPSPGNEAAMDAAEGAASNPSPATGFADLSRLHTHAIRGLQDGDLEGLPMGRQRLAGVEFLVRGMVRLESAGHLANWRRRGMTPPDSYPLSAVHGIPVPASCRRIHFLMGVDAPHEDAGAVVATWRIHRRDGSFEDRPVVYGRDVLDWHAGPEGGLPEGGLKLAWAGPMPPPHRGRLASLYLVTWENDAPDRPVAGIDFLLVASMSRPFVVAIATDAGAGR